MNTTHPTGIVTFLFTDIEGSTRLWEDHPEAMRIAHTRHNEILSRVIESNDGYVFQVIGDSFCAAFQEAGDAIRASIAAQVALQIETWGECVIKVRMGIHTGSAEIQENGDYQGYLSLSRVQRLMSAGHGRQTLLSQAAQALVSDGLPENTSLRDMGERRLKDLTQPEHIYQLVIEGLPADFPPLKTLELYRHNIPAQMTSFIGREKEAAEIKDVLRAHRLVTLTGSGGTGKTRLSLQVAADLLDLYPDGVWFVELAPLTDPNLIPQTILSALQKSEQEGKTALQTLLENFRDKKTLLILDNCEHLIEASAKVTETLLESAPNLRILASSREALGVHGELSWHVPSMALPDAKNLSDVDRLSQCESVRLFVERACLAQPRFRLTRDNASHVAQICARLDGIPLALELAAARVKALSVEQVAARLDDRFRLLTGGARTALPRQQTLRAMIDWSYNLLSEQERKLLRRLAVFVGGWTLEAAEQVCVQERSEFDVVDSLTHLVDKSLVIMDDSSNHVRYRMLETTRQYAREMLLASDETGLFRDRHLDFFLGFAETAKVEMRGSGQAAWLSLLETEHDNLRASLEWSLETKPELGLRIAAALVDFWDTRGYITEGRRWVEGALAKSAHLAPSFARVDAILGAMWLAMRQSELDPFKKWLKEGLALAKSLDYKMGIARGLAVQGVVVENFDGDLERAELLYNESLEIYRAMGDKLSIGQALGPLASCALKRYDFALAENLFTESLSLFREVGNEREIAGALGNLAETALSRRNYLNAQTRAAESLSLYRELEDKHGVATALRALGIAAHNNDNLVEARSASEESAAIFRELGDRGCLILTLAALARQLQHQGELQQALEIIREARGIMNEIAEEMIAASVFDMYGRIALARGDAEQARRQFLDGLLFQQNIRDAHFVPSLLEGLACVMTASSQWHDAIRLLGAASALREQRNLPLMQVERAEYDSNLSALKSKVDEATFQNLWNKGYAMPIKEAMQFALEKGK